MEMRFPRIFRRNDRWARQVDAYVDRRLTPVERELLEDRVGESERVRDMLNDTRALKSALRDMPEFEAPRSFALTHEMVAQPAPKPARAPAVTMRLAQATSFAAVAAFGILFAVDTVGTTTDGDDSGANMSTIDAASDGEEMRTTSGGGEAAGTGLAETSDDGAEPPVNESGDTDMQAEDYAPVSALEAPGSVEESSSRSLAPVYGVLGIIFVLALGAWGVARHQLRQAERI